MRRYKQDFPVYGLTDTMNLITVELKKVSGYESCTTSTRVIEKNEKGIYRPVLDEEGKPVQVDKYIVVTGSDDMDEAAIKTVVDKFIADVPDTVASQKAESDTTQYSRDRERVYPSWQDQLDQIFHEGIDAWKETIQAVKDAHPKPE